MFEELMFWTHTCVRRDNVSKTMMKFVSRNMLGCFDGEDEDENHLEYVLLGDRSI